MEWGGRWEGVQDGGIHVHPWLIHVNVWPKPPQYCKVISLQLKLKKKKVQNPNQQAPREFPDNDFRIKKFAHFSLPFNMCYTNAM